METDFYTLQDLEKSLNRDRESIRYHIRRKHVSPQTVILEGRRRLIFSKDDYILLRDIFNG